MTSSLVEYLARTVRGPIPLPEGAGSGIGWDQGKIE